VNHIWKYEWISLKMEIVLDFWNYYSDVVIGVELTCGLMKYDIVMSKK
jgi:hypothetical protein